MKKYALLCVLLCLTFSSIAQKKDFKIYNALLFDETPSLERYGIQDFHIIYEDGLITTNYKVKDTKAPLRRFIDIEKIMYQANESVKKNIPVCLDVEHWNLNDKSERSYSTDRYLELLNAYREIDSKNLVSVFHYASMSKEIYDASNVVYPAFYFQTDNMQDWYDKVNYFLRNVKRYGGDKPVYAFIWPQYNTNKSQKNKPYSMIDTLTWRKQLEYLYERCDGVVIWSHYRDEDGNRIKFDEKDPWFVETLKFIKQKKLNR